MSALHSHIRSLRAESTALRATAAGFEESTEAFCLAKMMLLGLANAKVDAAIALEAEQRELEARVISIPPRASE